MYKTILSLSVVLTALVGCAQPTSIQPETAKQSAMEASDLQATSVAIFAGGCFWCVEKDLERLPGVSDAISGYVGGHVDNPTYKQVSSGYTGHLEAVEVHFDPSISSYEELLMVFWRHIDPTDAGGQFVDRGYHYSTAIFYVDEAQKQIAEASKQQLEASGRFEKPVVTPIKAASEFWRAEEYHQDYYKKNPLRYKYYRHNSGRDQFTGEYWSEEELAQLSLDKSDSKTDYSKPAYSKPALEEIKQRLTPLQFDVTQHDATEPPFRNAYWDEKRDGIYVDVVSGEPLFSSKHKFKSGTGWPSFTQPLVAENVVEKTDYKLIYPRTEVRSKYGDSHLGHVFKDGPAPTGLRFCINSAALRFIPADQLQAEGYGHLAKLL